VDRLGAFIDPGRSLDDAVSRARLADSLGFDSVWATQLPGARDATVVLSAYALATETVRVGTGVLPIYTRHPTAMGQMAATLDELSRGRFILGVGVSHKVTVESMWGLKLVHPVEAMREYVGILRESLVKGSASTQGSQFTANWAYAGPRRAEMPILISALNPRMLELAGEIADGAVLWMCSPAYIEQAVVPHVRAGRERAGLSLEGFEIVAAVPASLTTNPEAGRETFRQTAVRYGSLPFYRRMMDASGFREQLERGEVSDAMVAELAGIGGEADIRNILRRYRDAGCTLPCVGPFAGHEGAAGFEATLQAAGA
jgi:F420-dependent oxidoreductase-like protein